MSSFSALPVELKLMIIDEFCRLKHRHSYGQLYSTSLHSLRAVNKELKLLCDPSIYNCVALACSTARVTTFADTVAPLYGDLCRDLTLGLSFDNARDIDQFGTQEEKDAIERDVDEGLEGRDHTRNETKTHIAFARDNALQDVLRHIRRLRALQVNVPTCNRSDGSTELEAGSASYEKTLIALRSIEMPEELRIESKRSECTNGHSIEPPKIQFGDLNGLSRFFSTTLRRLSLTGVGHLSDNTSTTFFRAVGTELPCLQSLSISGDVPILPCLLGLDQPLACADNLRSLDLSWCPDVDGSMLLRLCSIMPALERASVWFASNRQRTPPSEESTLIYELSNSLKLLSLRSLPSQFISDILPIFTKRLEILYPEHAADLIPAISERTSFPRLSSVNVVVGSGDRFTMEGDERSDFSVLKKACESRGARLECSRA